MIVLVFLLLPLSVTIALVTRGRFWKATVAVGVVNLVVVTGTMYVSNQPSDGFASLGPVLIGAALSTVFGASGLALSVVPKDRRGPRR
jgi:urea transporter